MTRLRPYLAGFLAVVLVLTSQGFALARTAEGPAGAMVICTGTGPVTVLVDEDGQPTGAVHICPDCALSLFDAISPASPAWLPDAAQSLDIKAKQHPLVRPHNLPDETRARAPPVRV